MALRIDRSHPEQAKIHFVLDSRHLIGELSVVGSFNDWHAGLDQLLDNGDGTRSTTLGLPYGVRFVFRYLGPGGHWFDESDADRVTDEGSVLDPLTPEHEVRR